MDFLKKYESFIFKNATQISSIESTLRSLTYILPGRFDDADLASEALFSTLNLLGIYHDTILTKHVASLPATHRPTPSALNRYTRDWQNSSVAYRRIVLLLTVIQYTEVLIEMSVQKKWGQQYKWRVITALETIKAVGRLGLMRLTNGRMLMHPVHTERDVDPAKLADLAEAELSVKESHWTGTRTGSQRLQLSAVQKSTGKSGKNSDVTDFLLSKVLTPDVVRKPRDLVSRLTGLGAIGECLFILRPIIYVLAMRKYGQRSWYPWFLSLAIELVSRTSIKHCLAARAAGGRGASGTPLEKDEMKRRLWLLLYYVLRSPFYDQFTKERLNNFCESASKKPLISLVGGIVQDYQPLWESVYFYTAGS
ncbi:Peroxisomal membrane protein pex16 [Entomortierella chlamydospora]|uniref:Peroxisomal membrane protein PEX16 n=1 Tax=Entomortierella chlamydospora TaxID=101097 RepID=A0A9P6N4W6_9FUNG|nr:Peroxisomal membrane protein pex16 [Entomortierella chlamydospora]KAG0023653.1 Peroxisomal membrane protein pex16 [Entomortierella chlamydospora]